jgi:uncharacterized protein (TIGR00106 family)
MLLELSIVPLGRGRSISADVADLVKIIDASGLDYRLTAAGTIIEGAWDQLMNVAKNCHGEMQEDRAGHHLHEGGRLRRADRPAHGIGRVRAEEAGEAGQTVTAGRR